jgi:hypothetical protein
MTESSKQNLAFFHVKSDTRPRNPHRDPACMPRGGNYAGVRGIMFLLRWLISSTKVGLRRLLGLLNHGKPYSTPPGTQATRAVDHTVDEISTATKLHCNRDKVRSSMHFWFVFAYYFLNPPAQLNVISLPRPSAPTTSPRFVNPIPKSPA